MPEDLNEINQYCSGLKCVSNSVTQVKSQLHKIIYMDLKYQQVFSGEGGDEYKCKPEADPIKNVTYVNGGMH
jgi:hypothetical protein